MSAENLLVHECFSKGYMRILIKNFIRKINLKEDNTKVIHKSKIIGRRNKFNEAKYIFHFDIQSQNAFS